MSTDTWSTEVKRFMMVLLLHYSYITLQAKYFIFLYLSTPFNGFYVILISFQWINREEQPRLVLVKGLWRRCDQSDQWPVTCIVGSQVISLSYNVILLIINLWYSVNPTHLPRHQSTLAFFFISDLFRVRRWKDKVFISKVVLLISYNMKYILLNF